MVGDSNYRQPLAPLIFLCLYLPLPDNGFIYAIDLMVIKPIIPMK